MPIEGSYPNIMITQHYGWSWHKRGLHLHACKASPRTLSSAKPSNQGGGSIGAIMDMDVDTSHKCNDENGNVVVGMPLFFNIFDTITTTTNNNNVINDDINNNTSLKRPQRQEENDHDCDLEDDVAEITASLGDISNNKGTPSPAEIKLKIKKSLLEFRCKVENAILGNFLLGKPDENAALEDVAVAKEKLREISLWGVPLMPSKAHEGTDVVLRKFLKAKDYKVNEAFDMLQKTLIWRRENNIDGIADDEDLEAEFGNEGFLCSRDRDGRPVCYHVCGVFKDRRLYKKTFGTHLKGDKFLRWRIQLMEKAIRKLSFRSQGGVDSILQVFDLKSTPLHGTKELSSLSKRTLLLFQNYYPELIHKNIIVYAPFWFYTSQVLLSRFMSQRNKKKFILARPHKVIQTLLKSIAAEHLPCEYGGLRRNNDEDFSPSDKALEHKIKGNSVSTVEFPVGELGVTLTWEATVVGWDVTYKEEFIPDDEGSYRVLLQNQNVEGSSTRNSFYISEPGKIVITVENGTYKKKKMYYRSKARTTLPVYILLS